MAVPMAFSAKVPLARVPNKMSMSCETQVVAAGARQVLYVGGGQEHGQVEAVADEVAAVENAAGIQVKLVESKFAGC